jgi:hypothetical protein
MGFDISGKEPTTEAGSYFRNNCWGWRPLWEYCESIAPQITRKVKYAQINAGDGLGARDSKRLGEILQQEITLGRTRVYQITRDAVLGAKPDLPCNGCHATGKVRPSECNYPFDVANVERFAEFLRDCGGFEIW